MTRTTENAERPVIVEHRNELLRSSRTTTGPTLLQMLDADLEAAWEAYLGQQDDEKKRLAIRGRVRGLAQAITTIRSPFSRQDLGAGSRAWAQAIKNTEDEALARARAKLRKAS